MSDFIEQLAALAEIERDLAAKFQTDRVGLGEWIDAMGAVNGYIRENVPAILALGRERDALRVLVAQYRDDLKYPPASDSVERRLQAIKVALEGDNQ